MNIYEQELRERIEASAYRSQSVYLVYDAVAEAYRYGLIDTETLESIQREYGLTGLK